MMKAIVSKSIFFTSVLIIISAAFNDGFSRFALAVPFFIIAGHLSLKIFKSYRVLSLIVGLSVFCMVTNLSLEKNPLVFPILKDGSITFMKDGYVELFSDGSAGYSETDKETIRCIGCGEIKYKKVAKGETYPVIGVLISHPDFSTSIQLVTPIGRFSENDYLKDKNISPNKAVKTQIFSYMSHLMYFPLAIFFLKDAVERILPGTDVIVEDDLGNLKKGTLSRVVTNGRPIKDGDKVRLNCTRASTVKNSKLCELEFLGVEASSPYPKNHPMFGKISSFSISVDSNGVPEKSLLIYK